MPTHSANGPQSDIPSAPETPTPTPHRQHRSWRFWLAPVLGVAALLWFLIRVVPKPDRASYPCQRAAFPIATGFILWITGFLGAAIAWTKARHLLARSKVVPAFALIIVTAILAIELWNATPENSAMAAENSYYLGLDGYKPHPVGTAKGVFPGRVAMIRNTDATTWDGVTTYVSVPGGTSYYKGWWGRSKEDNGTTYYDPNDPTNTAPASFTNQTIVEQMIAQELQWLTGTTGTTDQYDTKAAWTKIFAKFNETHTPTTGTKNDYNYYSGNKIFLKTNFVNANSTSWGSSARQYLFTSPEVVVTLLKSLNAVGVLPTNVYICDPDRACPAFFSNRVKKLLDKVSLGYPQFISMTASNYTTNGGDPIYFSNGLPDNTNLPYSYTVDKIPDKVNEATYLINLGVMKTHARNGVSMCGKNYVGILGRDPKGSGSQYDIHSNLLANNSRLGDVGADALNQYRDIVDLSGHPQLGGKCLLWIIDALYTGYDWSSIAPPQVWYSLPQKNGAFWYPSTIMMSLDPVAIDSVGLDMWKAEKYASEANGHSILLLKGNDANKACDPTRRGVEDYLLEMATVGSLHATPFTYKPDGTNALKSLGTFETMGVTGNNYATLPYPGKYSRNLGTGFGVELVTATPTVSGRWVFYNNSAWGNTYDDNKTPLLPGGTASFLNYTSFSKGINGIMIDVSNVTVGTDPIASDFEFSIGKDGSTWSTNDSVSNPTITINRGLGYNGSDRITLIWADKTIMRTWLKVHMKPNAIKNLPDDVFYVGNAPGDTGNSISDAIVDRSDEAACRADPHNFGNLADMKNTQDFNRDKKVDTTDEFVARSNATTAATALQLITVP